MTKRILRLTATPHAVAAGVAAGAFTSFTPFMGFHFILAFVLAWLVRGNLIASALGTFVGNPLTFPFIWAATYQSGNFLLRSSVSSSDAPALGAATQGILDALKNFDGAAALKAIDLIWQPILYPMLIGGTVVGILCSIPIYFATRRAAVMFRENRRDKLMAKAEEIRNRASSMKDNLKLRDQVEHT